MSQLPPDQPPPNQPPDSQPPPEGPDNTKTIVIGAVIAVALLVVGGVIIALILSGGDDDTDAGTDVATESSEPTGEPTSDAPTEEPDPTPTPDPTPPPEPTPDPPVGADSITVDEGQSFTMFGFEGEQYTIASGWGIDADPDGLGFARIQTIEIENTGSVPTQPVFTMDLIPSSGEDATVQCSTDRLEPGETATTTCSGIGEEPGDYDIVIDAPIGGSAAAN